MKIYEFTAKTVEKAIELGLKELNKKQEEVDIKIVDGGGFFKKAKIQILVEEDEKTSKETLNNSEKENISIKNENFAKKDEDNEIKSTNLEEIESFYTEKTVSTYEDEDKKIIEETIVSEVNGEVNETKKITTIDKNAGVIKIQNSSNETEFVKNYLLGLAKNMNVQATVEVNEDDEKIYAVIKSDKSGKFIGYRGEALNAIQYLTNISLQRFNEKSKRVVVDIENYREKREESLKLLAERIARKVIRTGKPYKFEPMTPNERRIIHTTLQQNENIETFSTGEEPRRYLTVRLKKND